MTNLYTKLRLDQSVTSSHLKILRDANIVQSEREGKEIIYTLTDQDLVNDFLILCAELDSNQGHHVTD